MTTTSAIPTSNIFISARAGSGKTYQLVQLAKSFPPSWRVLSLAFNKSNATDLARQMPMTVESATFNSCGSRIYASVRGYVRANEDKVANLLHYDLCGKQHAMSKRLRPAVALVHIAKCRGLGREELTNTMLSSLEDLYSLDTIEIPDDADDVRAEQILSDYYDTVRRLYAMSLDALRSIDFNDQILLPMLLSQRGECSFPYYDAILVDEAQDLNLCQIKFLQQFARTNPQVRFIFVGDPFQAIYAFRGADVTASDTIIRTFQCHVETLPICRRCSTAVIAEAQKVVPDILPMPDAETGVVGEVEYDDIRGGSALGFFRETTFILCRTRAPLVKLAIHYLRTGQPFELRAVSSWEPVLALHRKAARETTLPEYLTVLDDHVQHQVAILKKRGKRSAAAALQDSHEVLLAVADQLAGQPISRIPELLEEISATERGRACGIVLSTIHRAKGLEATSVYLLRPDLLPHPLCSSPVELEQERNLQYVAVTRARRNFYTVKPTEEELAESKMREKWGRAELVDSAHASVNENVA